MAFKALISIWVIFGLVLSGAKKPYCPCDNHEEFHAKCEEGLHALLEVKEKLSSNMGCSCICEDGYDVYWHHDPSEKYNWYRICGNKFLVDVARSDQFKGKRGGVIYWLAQDGVVMSLAGRRRLFELGQPLVAHDLRLPISSDVVFMPDYHYISYDGYQDLVNQLDAWNAKHPFEEKHAQVFWRGAPNGLRMKAVNISLDSPHINIGASSVKSRDQNLTELIATQGGRYKPRVEEPGWIRYRGIMDMDGHANAWGLYWRIAGGSVVFKVESNWTNGYIRDLIPSGEKQNYFKIKQDLSDMINITRLVTRNDTNSMILMKRVSHNARELARKHSYHNEVARVARELAHVFEEHEKIDDLRYRSGDIREDEAHQTDHKQQHVPGYTDGER